MRRLPKQSDLDPATSCGNEQHPDGPWHPAQYEMIGWWPRIVFWWRRRRYGCHCPTKRGGGNDA